MPPNSFFFQLCCAYRRARRVGHEGSPRAASRSWRLRRRSVKRKESAGDFLDNINVDGITECFEGSGLCRWKMFQISHTLKTATLADRHVPTLPRDNRNLAGCHCHKRRCGGWALNADARCPELNNVLPDIPFFAFAVPLELLETWREFRDLTFGLNVNRTSPVSM